MSDQLPPEVLAIKRVISEDRRKVVYRPSWKMLTGSVTSAILLSQVVYWWERLGSKPFYHFDAPPEAENIYYKPGLSWEEELGFSPGELRGAKKKLIKRLTLADLKDLGGALEGYFVGVFRDQKHRTWYYLNETYFYQRLAEHYQQTEFAATPDVDLTSGTPDADSPPVKLTSGQTSNLHLDSTCKINVSIPIETHEETDKENRDRVEINFDLPPYEHNQLLNKWVFVKQDERLVKGFVTKVTPQRLRVALEDQEGTRIVDPTSHVFYQNGYPQLQPVVLGDLASGVALTPDQLAMKNRLIDLTGAGDRLTAEERQREIAKCQEAAIFMIDKNKTIDMVNRFEGWFSGYWEGKNGEPITLRTLSRLWPTFERETKGPNSNTGGPKLTPEQLKRYQEFEQGRAG